MINLTFAIGYPWLDDKFKTLFYRTWKTPIKNKFFEIQFINDNENLLNFQFKWTRRYDHAGVKLELGLFGYELVVQLYDSRHWDYDKNDWVTHENQSTR
jgi:hypothetical protein